MSVSPEICAEVGSRLQVVEQSYGVTVLFACESGSRAWGFPSANSDFDVRFIYVRPVDAYLTIRPQRDVIEIPIIDEFDLSGWDLRKALYLLYKSNPALLEWLSCPIIYSEDEAKFGPFRRLSGAAFNPLAAFHHYRSMARQNVARMSTGEMVRLKHYLYTIRPLLACQWILRHRSQPPMLFMELVEEFHRNDEFRQELDRLMELKAAAEEVKEIPRVQQVNDYIAVSLRALEAAEVPVPERTAISEFNGVFREILHFQ